MRVVFMGTPDFCVPMLQDLVSAGHEICLVVTQPDRPKGRSQKPQPPPVKVCANELGLEVLQPSRMDEPGVMEALQGAAADVMAVAAFGHILKKDILCLPRLGCVNAHASLLPRFRGAAPIQWVIASGDEVTGVSTMLMDEGVDTGDILLAREVAIGPDDTGGSLHDKLSPVAAELMVETLAGLEAGSLKPVPQDESRATYAPMLNKKHGRIDWSFPAGELALRVRAFDPWPGTFTFYQGKQIKIIKAGSEDENSKKNPGEIIRADTDGIIVACGEGALRVLELQPPGKRKMTVGEYLAGHAMEIGACMG